MADSIWKRWEIMALMFVIVTALVVAGGYAAYGAFSTLQDPAESGMTVQVGDTVEVNYIGMFQDGTVFDTNIQSVAGNNTMYPKSLSFSYNAPFNPMSFKVGEGQMIQGFDNGVVGMGINQTRVLTIQPEDGYGSPNEQLYKTHDLVETFPINEWMDNKTAFSDIYGIEPNIGTSVQSEYGWDLIVYFIDPNTGEILLKNQPAVGDIVRISDSWDSKVISIDASANQGEGIIKVKHLLTSEDIGQVSGIDIDGQFIVSDVDVNAGTYTLDYNKEVVGKTLVFKVTVVSITRE